MCKRGSPHDTSRGPWGRMWASSRPAGGHGARGDGPQLWRRRTHGGTMLRSEHIWSHVHQGSPARNSTRLKPGQVALYRASEGMTTAWGAKDLFRSKTRGITERLNELR